MICGEILKNYNSIAPFPSLERPGNAATNSELRRWFERKSVWINGAAVQWNDTVEYIDSIILFPKSATKKITLW